MAQLREIPKGFDDRRPFWCKASLTYFDFSCEGCDYCKGNEPNATCTFTHEVLQYQREHPQ